MSHLFNLLNVVNRFHTDITPSLKRRVYGNYTFPGKIMFVIFLIILFFLDVISFLLFFIILFLMYEIHYIICGNEKWTFIPRLGALVVLILSIALFIFLIIQTYELLFYPRLYIRNEQPTCYYLDNNHAYKKSIIVDIFKNKALIKDANRNNYKNEYLRLINLNQIVCIHKKYPPTFMKKCEIRIIYKLLSENHSLKKELKDDKNRDKINDFND